ncbi:LuxR C-terminal-related transcriptional regulator [Actinophytocola sediminis]
MAGSDALGISDVLERRYRFLLTRPRWTPAELAAHWRIGTAAAEAAAGELIACGLASASVRPGAVRAVSPGIALVALATRRWSADEVPAAVIDYIGEVVAEYEQSAPRLVDGGVLADADDVVGTVERVVCQAKDEVIAVTHGGDQSSWFPDHIARAVLGGGVALGAVQCGKPVCVSYSGRGGCAFGRVIVDGAVVVLAERDGSGRILWSPGAVAEHLDLVERLWRPKENQPESQLTTVRHRKVLRLLAQGLSDEAVARRLGVSVRTVRGDIAAAMTALAAKSRFQVAVLATQRGLLRGRDVDPVAGCCNLLALRRQSLP